MGRIGSGICIYHVPVSWLIGGSNSVNALAMPRSAVSLILTLVVTFLFWHCFDGPTNQLKPLFGYHQRHLSSRTAEGLRAVVEKHFC
jgi:peptidoglycan/LPS O-acetylase OafA/YrhL